MRTTGSKQENDGGGERMNNMNKCTFYERVRSLVNGYVITIRIAPTSSNGKMKQKNKTMCGRAYTVVRTKISFNLISNVFVGDIVVDMECCLIDVLIEGRDN